MRRVTARSACSLLAVFTVGCAGKHGEPLSPLLDEPMASLYEELESKGSAQSGQRARLEGGSVEVLDRSSIRLVSRGEQREVVLNLLEEGSGTLECRMRQAVLRVLEGKFVLEAYDAFVENRHMTSEMGGFVLNFENES